MKWLPGASAYRVSAPRLPPGIRDGAALAFELAGFEIAHDGISTRPDGDRPEQRRQPACLFRVEPEVLVERKAGQRREIEDAGNGIAGRHEIDRRFRVERVPVGRNHRGGKMPAGRMSADQNAPAEPLPEKGAGALNLLDDVGKSDHRAKVVADHRDRAAELVEPARHVAVEGRIHRPPITAMNERDERRLFARRRQKQIDEFPRRFAVGKAKLGLAVLEHLGAIILRRARPAGENRGVIRHRQARTVFGLEDRGRPSASPD